MTKNCPPLSPPPETVGAWLVEAHRKLSARGWPPEECIDEAIVLGWRQYCLDPWVFPSARFVQFWCGRRAGWLASADRWLRRCSALGDDVEEDCPAVVDDLAEEEETQILRDCLAALPATQRSLLVRKACRGRTLKELALSMWGEGTNAAILRTWRRLGTAEQALRELLAQHGIDEQG